VEEKEEGSRGVDELRGNDVEMTSRKRMISQFSRGVTVNGVGGKVIEDCCCACGDCSRKDLVNRPSRDQYIEAVIDILEPLRALDSMRGDVVVFDRIRL
jgi:hypothetical protein